MNKMDITIMHVKACKDLKEACRKIDMPLEGFGYNLTKNEKTLLFYFARLYFGADKQKEED